MKRKYVCLALCLFLIIICSACGKTTYDFDKMADNLHEENGEDYSIRLEKNIVYVTRTNTLPKGGRNREKLANLSQEEFDDWANGWWLIIGDEQKEFEEVFQKNGNNYEVLITYILKDAEGNTIGTIDENGCAFTLDDLQQYRTIEQVTEDEVQESETADDFYGHVDVESAIMNTHGILTNYLAGRNVKFDTESLIVIAENIDEVMSSNLTDEKPISITNDGMVVEIEYENAVILWGLGADAENVSVVEK